MEGLKRRGLEVGEARDEAKEGVKVEDDGLGRGNVRGDVLEHVVR